MKNLLRSASIAALLMASSPAALAQAQFSTSSGGIVPGSVAMCPDGAGKAVPCASFTPLNIATSTTTLVKTGPGVLHGVTVNTKGTVASAVTIYDSLTAAGTKIGTVDSLNLSGAFFFDVTFANGLTVVTTGTVAPDITVSYR